MKKKQILINGKILSYYENLDWATDKVLVFLHGWMQDGKSFEKIFQKLEENNIPYISLDLPGFGWSALSHDDMNLDDYTEITIATIEKLCLTQPIMLWHSFGGRICINMGSYYKNMSHIVLLCAAWVQRKMPLHWYIIVKTGKIALSLPGLRRIWSRFREGLASPDLKNAGKMTKIFKNTIAQDIRDKMELVSYPTLMIWGKDDDQTPVEDAEIIHTLIEDSTLHILEWSHFVHQEKVQEVTHLILNFIKN